MAGPTYRLIDEIEPVKGNAVALSPSAPLIAAMVLPVIWLAAVSVGNSWLLGHPRRVWHLKLAVAAVVSVKAIVYLAVTFLPEVSWPYIALSIVAIRLSLGYYLTDEQEWAAELYEMEGGKVVGLGYTFVLIKTLARLVTPRPRR
ncbi:MAG: hypothetical protein HY815_19515 [Candidatus Riflebacteria bacterium]|nr:hypothetical protein [Candidatus Riflebacteria bacterium]